MATSGSASVAVTSWDTLKFDWSQTGQSIPNNCTYIKWTLTLVSGKYGAIYSAPSKEWNVTVNDTKHSGNVSASIGNNTSKTLASGTDTIYHNTDGTKSFAFSFSHNFSITFSNTWIGTKSGSGSGTLNAIPRQAEMTEVPSSFNDETTNLTVKFKNPGNFDLQFKIEAGGDTALIIRDKPTKSSPYTFVLSEDEKKKLRKKCAGNSLDVRFTVATYINGALSYWSWKDTKMSLINYMPTLSPHVMVTDHDAETSSLTGDADTIILNYTKIYFLIGGSPKKEATIASKKITCGNNTWTDKLANPVPVNSGTFVFSITDSRGYSASKTITKNTVNYIPLTCSLKTDPNLTEDNSSNVKLTVSGNYFSGSFGATNNSLTVLYRYKTINGEYPKDSDGNDIWTTIPANIITSNGTYTVTTTVNSLDYTEAYVWQAKAIDKCNTGGIFTAEQTTKIQPVFDWSGSDFNFNVPVHGARGFTYDIPVLKSTNCNEIMNSGKYYIGNGSTNRPVDVDGWLEVQSYDSGNYCYQKYITFSGEKYERWKHGDTWSSWTQLGPHVLWSGVWYMNEGHNITLSSPISAQANGIQLIFSQFNSSNNTAFDYDFSTHIVSKGFIEIPLGSHGMDFILASADFYHVGHKYLNFTDTEIIGTGYNIKSGTNSGITYNNQNWVLRYVIGF